MLMSEKKRFLFVHIYKTAGTSITSALKPFALSDWQWIAHKGLKKTGIPLPFFDPQPFSKHIKAQEIVEHVGEEEFSSYYSFTVVRNPWDWQVSLYTYMLKWPRFYQHELVKKLGSFENYVEWRCEKEIRYQKDFIYTEDNKLLVNYVARFESLETDFNKICSDIGVTASLPKLNVSNTKNYQDFYTENTKEIVRQAFEPDIKILNYSF